MSSQSPPTARPGRRAAARSSWHVDTNDPAAIIASARQALFVMVGVLALLWIIQIINWADGYKLTLEYGIQGRTIGSLPHIITAPFLHFNWAHIEGNSGPLFIFGFLAAYRGVAKFGALTAIVVVTSGLAAWFAENSHTVGAGASGVVFGYFGYIMVRGLFDRHAIDILVGAVMALCFAYQFTVLLPHAGIGWQAHIGGLVGGVVGGWLLRDRRAARSTAGSSAGKPAGGVAAASSSAGVGGAGTGLTTQFPAAASGSGASTGPGGAQQGAAGPYTGPRAELHKQLDDLGL